MTIFKSPELYPDEFTPFLTHFYEFDAVFIACQPFIQIDKTNNSKKTEYISINYENAVAELPILKNISNENKNFFGINQNYPTEEEIIQFGNPYLWRQIIANTQIDSFRDLFVAFESATNQLRKELRRDDLGYILEKFVETHNLWYPTAGYYNYFTRKLIYDFLRLTDNWLVNAETELYDEKALLNLNLISEDNFLDTLEKFNYIYPRGQKDFLLSIEYDANFFIIAIKTDNIQKSLVEHIFEGFWVSDTQNHLWAWTKEEIAALPKNGNL